jgi:hypothetical protein
MDKVEKILLLSAVVLLGAGWFLYDLGSRVNLEAGDHDRLLWEQAPGDKWLYVGGLMMLISELWCRGISVMEEHQETAAAPALSDRRQTNLYGRPTVGAPQ